MSWVTLIYTYAMFVNWLFEQIGRGDNIGRLARMVWGDYNAGCFVVKPEDAIWIKKHFEGKHKEIVPFLSVALKDAYTEYVAESSPHLIAQEAR